MVQLKRDSPAPVNFAAEIKKFKSDFEAELAQINAKFDSSNSVHCKAAVSENPTAQPCGSNEMAPNTQREKVLRRERGEMLLRLFREHPLLTDTATARTTEKNQERAQLWEEITRQINDTFSGKLEALSVEKTKKLLTYYKKKEDGSYDKIKYPSQSSLDEYPTDGDFDSTDPPSGCESDASEHGGFECDWFVTDSAINAAETDQRLRKFIASRGSSSCDLSVVKSESPPSTVFCDAAYNLKKERHDFVVSTAEHYLERMCFDSSSRSAQVNAERHNMWVKITHLTNEKYGNVLSPLAVEQAKKLFSNCKRRRRMRIESTSTAVSFDPSNANDANSTMDIVPTLDSFSTQVDDSPSHQFQNLMHGLDLSVEIGELRRQLAERDAEVARLQRIIVEQANDYRNRINSIVDFFKTVTERKVAEDIRNYLGVG